TAAIDSRPRRRGHRVTRESVLAPLDPRREVVEGDAQRCRDFGECSKAAWFAPRFDFGQVAGGDPGGGGAGIAPETAMSTPNADRMLAIDEPADEFARQIVGAGLLFADFTLARFDGVEKGVVLGILEALDQCLVFSAGQGHGIGLFAHRYISLRCSMRSKIPS